jgi:ribonuclease D
MSESQRVRTALSAADSALFLQSPTQISQAARAWQRCSTLGLDTEFVRERTYHANIGLVQISDGRTVWLLDPLVDGAVEPLAQLLSNRAIAKIVHSPSEDLEVLMHATGALPDPVLDTQIACAMLGQPLQLGYHNAVEWLLGVAIDKDQTRSNWCARPLRQAQLRYAALDVCLLPLMWRKLEAALEKQGRLGWFMEDCGRQIERARNPLDSTRSWQRIRGHGRLDGTSLAILMSLAEWRENVARKRNRPRGFIVPDSLLLAIASRKMTSLEELAGLDDLHPMARQRHGTAIIRIVAETLDSGHQVPPVKPLTTRQRKLLKQMRDRVLEKAGQLGIEPALLAPRKELEELVHLNASEGIPERLQGWRKEAVTGDLLGILNGHS